MQYQVLARKWRPQDFSQLVGQEHVLRALVNALDQERLHHAYLFTGTRGVGKTTIARILAKCLNCEEKVSSIPCDQCSTCSEISEGRCVDLIEVDAASRTKVEDTRDLLDNVQYAPTRCRYKIYLIDEVHMLSTHSFNALLKTLEEPPPHVKFLLATTDPQKLPVTILSRCLQFNLKNLPAEQIVSRLGYVLEQESIPFDESALWQLGRAADGSMRDALSLTDQAIAYGESELREMDVANMLGTIERGKVYELLAALCSGDAAQMLEAINIFAEYSPDYSALLEALISVLHRIAVAQAVPDSVDDNLDNRDRIEQFASQITPEDLQLYYQIALIGRRDLPLNPDPRSGLEMVMLRMLAFQPATNPDKAVKKKPQMKSAELQRSPNLTGSVERPAGLERVLSSVASQDSRKPKATDSVPSVCAKLDLAVDNLPTEAEDKAACVEPTKRAVTESDEDPGIHQDPPPRAPTSWTGKTRDSTIADLEQINTNEDWQALAKSLPLSGMTKNVVFETVLASRQANQLQLQIERQYRDLFNEAHQTRLTGVLGEYFGAEVQIQIESADHSLETPAQQVKRLKQEAESRARHTLEADQTVKQIIERFDARFEEGSVEPIE